MLAQQTGRYSKYIRPISIAFDLIVISALSSYFLRELNLNMIYYLSYQALGWLIIALSVKFYNVYR